MLTAVKKHFTIILLTIGHGMVDLYIGLLQVVAPGLAVYLGLPLGDLVILMGISNLMNNITQPITGYFMNKRNMAWILPVGIVCSTLPTLMGFATGYWSLVALVLLGAAGTGVYHPEGILSAHDATGEKSYLGVPLFFAGGAGIYALMTPLSLRISESYGFPAMTVLAIPGLAVALIFLLQYRHRRRTHPSLVLRPRSKRLTRVVDGHMSYWPLLTVSVFLSIAFGLFLAILSSHFELLFGSESRIWSGYVLMTMGFAGSLASFFWASLAKKHGFYKICLITQLIAAPLYAYMAFPASPAIGFLVAIPLSLVNPNTVYPTAVTMARDAAGMNQSMRTSIMMGGTSGLSSIAVLVAGVLMRREVPSEYLIFGVAACCLVAVLLSAWQTVILKKK